MHNTLDEGAIAMMKVKKRSGALEAVDMNKILHAINDCAHGLPNVDPMKVATKTVGGLHDGATTRELDELAIQVAASFIYDEPEYSLLASRLVSRFLREEAESHGIVTFFDAMEVARSSNLLNEKTFKFITDNKDALNQMVDHSRDDKFEYFGIKTLADRYLLKHPTVRYCVETPQFMFLRVACGLFDSLYDIETLYGKMSKLQYLPSSPTLFNSGTLREQMSSCYLLDSPEDDLQSIYDKYKDIAMLSKFAGGIGVSFSRIRSRGSLIKGTNGFSNGVVPFLKTLDSSVSAVNQCFLPGTYVRASDGWTRIEAAKNGVVTETGEVSPINRLHKYDHNGTVVRITTDASLGSVSVTPEHPILAMDMNQCMEAVFTPTWTPAGKLTTNHVIAYPKLQLCTAEKLYSPDDMFFYGVMLNCGTYCSAGREAGVTIAKDDEDTRRFIDGYMKAADVFTWSCNDDRLGKTHIRWKADQHWLKREHVFDAGVKRVHKDFYGQTNTGVSSFIEGMASSGGNITGADSVTIHTHNKLLCLGILDMCLYLGVAPTCNRTAPGTYMKPAYAITIPAPPGVACLRGIKTAPEQLSNDKFIASRVSAVNVEEYTGHVYDMTVDGPESYLTTLGVAHNGGKRKGAACAYLESWHADIEQFLELRDNTGDHAQRTYNLNIANWVPDEFMRRVKADGTWSLFDPNDVPEFVDLYGKKFDAAYLEAEANGLAVKEVPARDLYLRMMRTLAQTGNGWMCFKDRSNVTSNQTNDKNVIHLSNLCTEILEVNNTHKETSVCNLGSINLGEHVDRDGNINRKKLKHTVETAIRQLDTVVDRNFYPIKSAKASNSKWRPIGLGCMGFQDALFKMGIPFDDARATELARRLAEFIYFHALSTSVELAKKHGKYEAFDQSKAAKGVLHVDHWNSQESEDWGTLRETIKEHGLRNSLVIAIAPTATIASISGCYECIEPLVSNLFKRETLSGEFLQINKYLVKDLKKLGLWTPEVRNRIKASNGSLQSIEEIPAPIRHIYRTAWELPMKAIIDNAAARAPYIDQSQSLNLFIESPTIGKLSSMYMYLWEKGLKTSYYLRSRPATNIAKTTVDTKTYTDEEALVCSLENPESCESCT